MKKLKALLSFAAISLGVTSMPVSAAIVNVPVVNNAWTFIGVPGFQNFGGSEASATEAWPDNFEPTIIDGSTILSGVTYTVGGLEVPTWDGNVSNAVTSAAYATIDDNLAGTSPAVPRDPNGGGALGSNIYGTIGVMAIGQDTSAAKSSTTDHNGATVVALRPDTKVYKSSTSSIRSMYIRTENAEAPDIKVYYQANQEGNTFRFRYSTSSTVNTLDVTETGTTVYAGTFDRDYTYDSPAVVGEDFLEWTPAVTDGVASGAVKNILHAFDMDLSDNNLTAAADDMIEPNLDNDLAWTDYGPYFDTNVSYALRQPLDGNLTVLWYDSDTQQWRQVRATGDGGISASTYLIPADAPETTDGLAVGDLEAGRGYWVKLDTTSTSVAGFVLGTGTITHDLTANGTDGAYVADGWNMLSFEDDYLSYSVTGMVLTDDYAEFNVTDTYGAVTLGFTTAGLGFNTDALVACMAFNQAVDGNNSIGYTNIAVKCIPSATETAGILVSTRRFTVGVDAAASGITSLAGETLTSETNGVDAGLYYKSTYGQHSLVFEQNGAFADAVANGGIAMDGNMSVEYPLNTIDPAYALVSQVGVATTAANVLTSMGTASSGLSSISNEAVAVDMNFDGVDDSVLMGSNYRFFIKDATQIRVFTYDNTYYDTNTTAGVGTNNTTYTTSVRIWGDNYADATMTDDDLDATVLSILVPLAQTGVYPMDISSDANNTLMLIYNGEYKTHGSRAGLIDLQENAHPYDVFTEVYPENETNATAKGAITKVWQISKLTEQQNAMADDLSYDGNYSSKFAANYNLSDLRFNAYFAESFPIDGPLFNLKTDLGVKAESIITGQTFADGSYISWKQIDVSKPTDEWYDTDDQFELFWTEKEKGYWVYINGTAENDLTIDTPTIETGDEYVYAHFNNRFSGTSTSALTRNHLNKTLSVTVNNLTSTALGNTDSYEVYANISGTMTSLQRSGASDTFFVLLNSHETNGIGFDEGEIEITITAAEGSGKRVSTTYVLDYEKPEITAVAVDGAEATVSVTDGNAVEFHVYTGDINDSKYGSTGTTNWAGSVTLSGEDTVINLGDLEEAIVFADSFENNASAYLEPDTALDSLADQLLEGIIRDVRIVAKDDAGLYSDQERVLYLPWKSGTGVLSSTADGVYDSAPVVYNNDGTVDATYNGGVTENDGVQVATATSNALTCVFSHLDVANNEDVGITKTLVNASGTMGVIIYDRQYKGQPLVCQQGSVAYVAGFTDELEGSNGSSAQIYMVPLQTTVTITK